MALALNNLQWLICHYIKKPNNNNNNLDLAREQRKLRNMPVTVIPIVTGALGTLTEGLVQRLEDIGIRGRVETIQTTALLRPAIILRRVLET